MCFYGRRNPQQMFYYNLWRHSILFFPYSLRQLVRNVNQPTKGNYFLPGERIRPSIFWERLLEIISVLWFRLVTINKCVFQTKVAFRLHQKEPWRWEGLEIFSLTAFPSFPFDVPESALWPLFRYILVEYSTTPKASFGRINPPSTWPSSLSLSFYSLFGNCWTSMY